MAKIEEKSINLSEETIGFIGGGNMARAIAVPLIKKGFVQAKNIWVSARTEKTLEFWKDLGVNTTLHNIEVCTNCQTVVLAVKPQFLNDALRTIEFPAADNLWISVIVGITIDSLVERFLRYTHQKNVRLIRTLPNTPLAVGKGITVYSCLPEVIDSRDSKLVEAIFSKSGVVERIDESMMNAVSALSGSGPAYAYLMIEALADGAVKNGVPRALANKLAAQMFVGAGEMVLQMGKHPGQLKDEVCSPGGTTIAGVHALETSGVRGSLMNAIDAAVQRANEFKS
ncbi:pyrroline-5-carboxylate reductase [Fopius arisanus]|uniref:Pyrroline-5-carboxylate reductase n=1 Tax=Fopius arisanus TaxID=64838 RepID=A0A9R1T1E4_9HYME|nr:PREDICTED: pyrroline-5-carboxylate reductase [Fopius arisanus]